MQYLAAYFGIKDCLICFPPNALFCISSSFNLLLVPFKLWKMVSSKHIGNMTSILRQTGQWYQPWNWVRGITQPCKMFRAVFDCLLRFIQEFLHWVLHSSSLISQGNSHQLIRWKIIHTIVSCILPCSRPQMLIEWITVYPLDKSLSMQCILVCWIMVYLLNSTIHPLQDKCIIRTQCTRFAYFYMSRWRVFIK